MAPKPPLFLERHTYRYRRAVDAARLLPVLGVMLWLLPAIWSQSPGSETSLSSAMLYIFSVWLALICLGAFVASRIARGGYTSNDPAKDTPPATPDKTG